MSSGGSSPRRRPTVLGGVGGSSEPVDTDLLCPVCFELLDEAHITRCGHTFCRACAEAAADAGGRCPKCACVVSRDQLFPSALLDSLVARHKAHGPPAPGAARALIDAQALTLPDVNVMLEALTARKAALEAESSAAQNRLLLDFLTRLEALKEKKQAQVVQELALVRRDMAAVEAELTTCTAAPSEPATGASGITTEPAFGAAAAGTLAARRQRMRAHFDDFVTCYFTARAKDLLFGSDQLEPKEENVDSGPVLGPGLDTFRENLVKFSRYDGLRPLATLNYSSDIFTNSTIVSSIEFDKDNELFAIAGVTKRIKVFDYGSVVRDAVDIHYPCVEMVSTSKISCVSWNAYHKATLASSDYEGTVTVWDASTGQRTKTFQEHEKRCWSVDFNSVDSRLLASGSDDARVKLWSLNQEHSVASLEAKANVCCVKFSPTSACHLAFGSADHCVHYYDLRQLKQPLAVLKGHRKAVSYVKFLGPDHIVSASTDSQLKVWSIGSPHCLRSLVGHANEKNFVGLATDGDYVACGSENNALYVYYKGLSQPLFNFTFAGARGPLDKGRASAADDDANEFVSAVCWRQGSNVVVAANSQGVIKLLELV